MKVILYTTHCPKCEILESKLKNKNVAYEINDDVEQMLSLGISEVPQLKIENKIFNFGEAVRWVNELKE